MSTRPSRVAGALGLPLAALFTMLACDPDIYDLQTTDIEGSRTASRGSITRAFRVRATNLPPQRDWQPYVRVDVALVSDDLDSAVPLDTADTGRPPACARLPGHPDEPERPLRPGEDTTLKEEIDCPPRAETCEVTIVVELTSEEDLDATWAWSADGAVFTFLTGCGFPVQHPPDIVIEEVDASSVPTGQARQITLRAGPGEGRRRNPPDPAR